MMRVVAIVLVILVGYDHVMYNGKFVSAAVRTSTSILHHFGVG